MYKDLVSFHLILHPFEVYVHCILKVKCFMSNRVMRLIKKKHKKYTHKKTTTKNRKQTKKQKKKKKKKKKKKSVAKLQLHQRRHFSHNLKMQYFRQYHQKVLTFLFLRENIFWVQFICYQAACNKYPHNICFLRIIRKIFTSIFL